MSITSPLATFQTGTYSVARTVPGTRVDGIWVEGSVTTTPGVGMSIRPMSGQDLKSLPEGQRVEDMRAVMTTFDLLPRDVITYKGVGWTVSNVRDWNVRGVTYVRATMQKNPVGV